MTVHSIKTTIVNHVAIDMTVSPDLVWQAILGEYVEALKFRELGYVITPLPDDPGAVLGGLRMQLLQGDAVVDDRICRFTERDDAERRLSVFAEYITMPVGMTVYVTYQAEPIATGTRYRIDCHSTLHTEAPGEGGPAGIADHLTALRSQFEAALTGYLITLKAKLEERTAPAAPD